MSSFASLFSPGCLSAPRPSAAPGARTGPPMRASDDSNDPSEAAKGRPSTIRNERLRRRDATEALEAGPACVAVGRCSRLVPAHAQARVLACKVAGLDDVVEPRLYRCYSSAGSRLSIAVAARVLGRTSTTLLIGSVHYTWGGPRRLCLLGPCIWILLDVCCIALAVLSYLRHHSTHPESWLHLSLHGH